MSGDAAGGSAPADLLAIVDGLYALPLEGFTAERDTHVRALKREHPGLSGEVKALRKPSTAAWVVNRLVRAESGQVERVLAVGEALREAQRSMSGEDLRALTRQRRQLTAAVTQTARRLAREAGLRVTEAVAVQVEATLTAAMLDAGCAAAVRSGLLVTALASTGVGEVDALPAVALPAALGFTATPDPADEAEHAAPGRGGLHVVPDPDAAAKARAEAVRRLEEAREALAAAQGEHDALTAERHDLEARSLELSSQVEEVRRRLAEAESAAEQTDDELSDAEEAEADAADALAEATRARDEAQAALTARDALPG